MKYILFLTLLLLPSAVAASEKNEIEISTLLFPETKTWIDVSTLPKVTDEWLQKWKWMLRKTYLELPPNRIQESPDCSFITRSLYESDIKQNLYLFDIDTDGINDAIYVGPAQCSEGDISIVWHGSKTKAGDLTFTNHKPDIVEGKILRLSPSKVPKISSFIYGCCAALTDKYLVGYVDNQYRIHRLNVLKDLVYPSEHLDNHNKLSLGKELILRSSPEEINDYDKSNSERAVYAVFGNIQRKYLPGVECLVIAKEKLRGQDEWLFVAIEESNNYLLYYSPYEVNVGWIKQ